MQRDLTLTLIWIVKDKPTQRDLTLTLTLIWIVRDKPMQRDLTLTLIWIVRDKPMQRQAYAQRTLGHERSW